jgi:ABC-type multidrug transport system ATPase subunit
MGSFYFGQLKTLLYKNFIYQKEDRKNTIIILILILLYPFIITTTFGNRDFFDDFSGADKDRFEGLSLPEDINNKFVSLNYGKSIGFIVSGKNENIIDSIMRNQIFNQSSINPVLFENEENMENFYKSNPDKLLAGVIINPEQMSYTIRVDGSSIPDPSLDKSSKSFLISNNYINAFTPIQMAIDQALIQTKTGNNTINIIADIGKLPLRKVAESQKLKFWDIYGLELIVLILVLPMLKPVQNIVSERENNIKSFIMLIGMNPFNLWLSWLIYNSVLTLIITFYMSVVFAVLGLFKPVISIAIFIIMFLFGISLNSLVLLASTFFRNSKTAYAVMDTSSLIFILLYIPFYFCPEYVKNFVSFFISSVSSGVGLEKIILFKKSNKPQQEVFFQKDILIAIGLLVWNAIFYFVLALISDHYQSDENKISKSKKKQLDSTIYEYLSPYEKDIEQYHGSEKSFVEVSHIFKEFKNKNNDKFLAVNNVSFKAYKNEIFCILGHNGAGKSTLVKIMTGLILSDKGTIYYDGRDFNENKIKIRQEMGICSQDNIFFNLSVEQNIHIFSGLKGIEDYNVDEILEKVDLLDKKTTKVEELSGGQKRKLCIALAILGNPKYLFFDEPTTGLDPVSRRNIWNLLSSLKKDKIIFLTTHYMDEADILADRKLILTRGVIRCLGSSVYLKNHFRMMYFLNIQTNYPKEVNNIIQSIIPTAIIENNKNKNKQDNFTWKLPIDTTSQFKNLFNEIDKYKNNDNLIINYSIKSPSLEDIFISLSENDVLDFNDDNSISGNNDKEEYNSDADHDVLINDKKLPDPVTYNKISSSSQFIKLIKLRYKIYIRNVMFNVYSIFIPVVLSLLLFIVLRIIGSNGTVKFNEKEISANTLYKNSNELLNIDLTNSVNLDKSFFNADSLLNNVEYNDVNKFNTNNTSSLKSKDFTSSISGKLLTNDNYSFEIYYNETKLHSIPFTVNQASNLILNSKGIKEKITVKSYPFSYYDFTSRQTTLNTSGMILSYIIIFGLIKFGTQAVSERAEFTIKQLNLNGVKNKTYWLSLLVNDASFAILSCVLILIAGIICKYEAFMNIYSIIIMLVILILSTIGSLLFQYFIGLFFKNKVTAYSYIPSINILIIGIEYFIVSIITVASSVTANTVFNKYINYTYAIMSFIYPSFSIIVSMTSLTLIKVLNELNNEMFPLTLSGYLSFDKGISIIIIALLLSIIFYFIILIVVDEKRNSIRKGGNNVPEILKKANEEYLSSHEKNVEDEDKLVKNHFNEYPLSILGVNKEFKIKDKNSKNHNNLKRSNWNYGEIHHSLDPRQVNPVKTIIEDVTFHVNCNECFGLLGPNGAGKSTLLNMLTGLTAPTFGNIYYDGKIISDYSDLIIGYCPQEDIFWKELTLREHLEFFLELRGYPEDHIKEYADQYLSYCELEEHQNKKVTQLSGGTKRKLSVLLAVCGYPKYIILDEPTAGMDPHTRRFVWNIIEDIKNKQQSSITMTSHSMEEAEALCDRLTILIDGRLGCIGSPKYLTMTYATDYTLEVESDKLEQFHKSYIESPNSVLNGIKYRVTNETEESYKYYIENKCEVGKLFELLEDVKNKNIISDYILTESSLDKVFIDFVKKSNIES